MEIFPVNQKFIGAHKLSKTILFNNGKLAIEIPLKTVFLLGGVNWY